MAVIANMDIVLGARTQKLDVSLDQTTAKVKRFELGMGGVNSQASSIAQSIATIAAQWASAFPIISSAASVFQTVAASIQAMASTPAVAAAAVMANSHAASAKSTAVVAATLPVVAVEARVAAEASRDFARNMLIAAAAAKLGNGGSGRNGMTLFNPAIARAGARGGKDDAIDAEFTVLGKGATAAASGVSTAVAGLSTGAIAAGAAVAGAFVAVVAGAAAAAIAISGVRSQMTEIDNVSDSAKKLGMNFADLASLRLGLGQSSGLDQGGVDMALQRMQLGLAEAKTGSGELAGTLKALGLDAGKLINAGPVDALKQISVATAQLKSPTDQLQVAYQLFGKNGAALVSSLREGPAAIQESVAAAKDLGLTLTQAQAEQVGAANDTWEKVYLIGSGVFRQIAAEVAPVLQVIGQEILAVGGHFGSFGEYLPPIIDGSIAFGGYLYDAAELASLIQRTLYNIVTLNWDKVGEGIESAFRFDTADKMLAKVKAARDAAQKAAKQPAMGDVDLALFEQQQDAQKKAGEAATAASNAQKAAADRAQESIRNRIGSLQDEVDVLRLGEQAARAMQLARDGADSTQIAQIQRLEQQKKAINDQNDLLKKGEGLKAQFSSPMDKLKTEVLDLQKLLDAKAIDRKTFDAAAMDAAKKLPQKDGPKAPLTIAAFERGSVEQYSASRKIDADRQQLKNEESFQRQQLSTLAAILQALKGGQKIGIVGG